MWLKRQTEAEKLKKVEKESLEEVDELIDEIIESSKANNPRLKHYATWEEGLADCAESLANKKERGEILSSNDGNSNEW